MDSVEVLTILTSYQKVIGKTSIKLPLSWFYENISIKSLFDRYKKGIFRKQYLRDRLEAYPNIKVLFIPDFIKVNKDVYLTCRAVLYDQWLTDEFHRKFVADVDPDEAFEKYSDSIWFLRSRQYFAYATLKKHVVTFQDEPNERTKLL